MLLSPSMRTASTPALLVAGLLLAAGAQAQTSFSIGPRVGLYASTIHYSDDASSSPTSWRTGFEAGLTSNVQFGHFALQPSVLFTQRGYGTHGSLPSLDLPMTFDETVRLNYLTLPLNLAYTLGQAGQGLQLFAGPYVGLLVGGHYEGQRHQGGYPGAPASDSDYSGKVKPASVASDTDNRYSRRLDTGLQAGLGYRLGAFQLQASYSLGLRNLATQYRFGAYTYNEAAYRNRAWQVSLSYLVGPKS